MNAVKTDWYELKNDGGRWVLIVLCGGIAMFERRLALSKEEEAYIGEYGVHFVEKLAIEVSRTPETFGARIT